MHLNRVNMKTLTSFSLELTPHSINTDSAVFWTDEDFYKQLLTPLLDQVFIPNTEKYRPEKGCIQTYVTYRTFLKYRREKVYIAARSSRLQMFFKEGIFKNVLIFTGKHLCWSLFLKQLQIWGVFPWILRNFYGQLF